MSPPPRTSQRKRRTARPEAPPPVDESRKSSGSWWILAVLAVTAAALSPCLQLAFVNVDDGAYVYDNLLIRSLSFRNFVAIFTGEFNSTYVPLTVTSFAFEHALVGLEPWLYHTTNLLLHLANTYLVYRFVRLLTGHAAGATVAALLFGVHTLHVESVAWVTERKDVLYTLFYVASLCAYVRWLDARDRRSYLAALGLFVLALLSKGQAVTLVLALVAIAYLRERPLLSRDLMKELLPFAVLALVFGIVTLAVAEHREADVVTYDLSQRLLFAAYAYAVYLSRLVFPWGLSAIYPYPVGDDGAPLGHVYLVALGALAAVAAMAYCWRRHRAVAFGLLFFTAHIGLMLQLVPRGIAYLADRFTYVASIGPFITIGVLLKDKLRSPKVLGALGLYAALLCGMTFTRALVWKNSGTLFDDVIAKYPRAHPLAYNNRGLYLQSIGDRDAALKDFQRATELDPAYFRAHLNLGNVYTETGDTARAEASYAKVIELSPGYVPAHANLGALTCRRGDYKACIEHLDRALELDPTMTAALRNRGMARIKTGDRAGGCKDLVDAGRLGDAAAASLEKERCQSY